MGLVPEEQRQPIPEGGGHEERREPSLTGWRSRAAVRVWQRRCRRPVPVVPVP